MHDVIVSLSHDTVNGSGSSCLAEGSRVARIRDRFDWPSS
jgi:hypothetical protein